MDLRPESDEVLVQRLLPSNNPNPSDRAEAWSQWQVNAGRASVLKFIRYANNTEELDEDILQDALLTAFLEVERGHYQPQEGVPFTAYVKGIARNKIREARRKRRGQTSLENISQLPGDTSLRQLERTVERDEQHRMLELGLAHLPMQRRRVLECYIFGKSTSEIAREMSITEELVRQHKSRGVRRLRQMGIF